MCSATSPDACGGPRRPCPLGIGRARHGGRAAHAPTTECHPYGDGITDAQSLYLTLDGGEPRGYSVRAATALRVGVAVLQETDARRDADSPGGALCIAAFQLNLRGEQTVPSAE